MCVNCTRGPWRFGGDEVTRHEQRLAKLRDAVPSSERTVGYVSERRVTSADIVAMKEYVLTVYTLAPVRVELNASHRYVVGNFTDGSVHLPQDAHLMVEQDFGDGVLLLRSDDR
jgi:hypothetical protein